MARRSGAETKAVIEAQALRLFAAKGVDATSMRDLAVAAGVAEAAIYRHFASKEAIGQEIFAGHYAELAGWINGIGDAGAPFAEQIVLLVEMFCTLFDEQPDVFAFLLISQHSFLSGVGDARESNAVSALVHIMARAHRAGELAITQPDFAAAMALGVVVQPAVFKLYGRLPGTMAERAEELAKGVMNLLDVPGR